MSDRGRLMAVKGEEDLEVSEESSGEYSYKVSNQGLRDWKDAMTVEKNETEMVPIKNQITFSWCHINAFSVKHTEPEQMKKKIISAIERKESIYQKHILKNVCGVAHPGELLVIMGSSGAGKTTLMNCMTFRNLKDLTVSGLVCINNKPVTQVQLATQSAYVQQDDLFIKYLTVREHLIFQSQVRMEADVTLEKRFERVEEVMRELSLKKCENSIIGLPGIVKGISGGERKRLALASELLTNPALLFCDEPTTGLDSFMSLNVVQMLKDLSRTGRTVITTLHQPSSELFHLFDKLCLMAEGRTAFLGTTSEASEFFRRLEVPCPKNFNPADHYIQTLAILPGKEEACKKAVNSVCDAFEVSALGYNIRRAIEKREKSIVEEDEKWSHKQGHISPYRVGWLQQMKAVFWRTWLSIIKNPDIVQRKIFLVLMESLLITVIYYGQTLDQLGITNINGIFFYILTSISFQNLFASLDIFGEEMPLFMKEHKDGMYRTDVYYIAKVICCLPVSVILSWLNVSVCYYLVGLNPNPQAFITTLIISALLCLASQGLGYIISCGCGNIQLAITWVGPLVTPLFLFGGIYINFSSIPPYLVWVSELSWFRYGYQALMINQWEDVHHIDCPSKNMSSVCMTDGQEVLLNRDIHVEEFWPSIYSLIILIIAFRIVAFIILYFKASRKE